jgi:hypothetical protein
MNRKTTRMLLPVLAGVIAFIAVGFSIGWSMAHQKL